MDCEDNSLEQDSGAAFHPFRREDSGLSIKWRGRSLHKTIDRPCFFSPQSQDQKLAKLRWIINPLNL